MNKLFIWVTCIVLTLSTLTTSAATIQWETFPNDGDDLAVQLGRLEVPLRHAEPDGKKIEIAFVRLRSTAKKPGSPIVYLNGGPGQPATPFARSKDGVRSFSALREISDVILLDQRGTGLSQPDLRCPGEPPPIEDFFSDHYPVEPAVAYFAACTDHFKTVGIDLGAINTRESANDLDSIRAALGVEQLSLLGFSYGTHLGLAAIRQLGNRIERATLVGTEGPDHTEKLPVTMDTQIAKLARLAALDPAIRDDVPDMAALARKALARLEREPMTIVVKDRRSKAEVKVKVGRWGLEWIVLRDIADTSDLPYFPALFHQVANGNDALLSWFVEKRYNQIGGAWGAMSIAMDCASSASDSRATLIEAQKENSLFGHAINGRSALCASAPQLRLDDEFRATLISDVPVLFVSGTLDAKTPPYQAEEVRWGLTSSMHVIVTNAGHEDLIPDPRVQSLIGSFFRGEAVDCVRLEKPSPKFVPVETRKR